MKITLFVLFLAFVCNLSHAQTASSMEKETVRKIVVTGTAEVEVIPDEIYFSISLREYFKDDKSQKEKIALETLEKQLLEALKMESLSWYCLEARKYCGFLRPFQSR